MVVFEKVTDINTNVGKTKLYEQISSLYLNHKFSDLNLVVEGEKLPAHKVILAVRSKYFENLIFGDGQTTSKSDIVIEGVSLKVFKMLLKYIYKGGLTLLSTNFDLNLELLSLAHQYSMTDLELVISDKLQEAPNLENVFNILNYANLHDLIKLRDFCYNFMDKRTSEVLTNTNFTKLTNESITKLLERDNFLAPEIEIFNAVAKWCEVNGANENIVVKCVRLSCLTVVQIVSIVWPSRLVDNEILLNAIAEIVDVKPRKIPCRSKLLWDENVATPAKNATVIHGNKTEYLLTGNRDVNKWAICKIGDKNGFTIKLGELYTINHIFMSLFDGDKRSYNYYIEVSTDQQTWKKVIDYTQYACRSYQNLYFDKMVVQYVRVVGTHNTADTNFHLIFFEADCKENIPEVVNGMIRPILNVATLEKKAVVIEGYSPENLLNGQTTGYTGSNGYTSHTIGSGSNIIIQLAQPYLISTMKFLLWDLDDRYYHYYIETSMEKTNWEMVVDRKNEKCQSWQTLKFPDKPMVFIKIVGTFNSIGNVSNLHFICNVLSKKSQLE